MQNFVFFLYLVQTDFILWNPMRSSHWKSTLIWLISYGILLLVIYISSSTGFPLLDMGENNLLFFLFFSFFWFILSLLRNTKDQNTNYLKIWLIIAEVYIILYLMIKPYTNFTINEFIIRYSSLLLLFFWATSKQKTLKILWVVLWIWLNLLMRSINFLMIYRQEAPINEFINNQDYQLILLVHNSELFSSKLQLKSPKSWTQSILLDSSKTLSLKKWENYTMTYESQSISWEELALIVSPLGEILQIPPQSFLTLSTEKNAINFNFQINSWTYFSEKNQNNIPEIRELQENYHQDLKSYIIKSLPTAFQNNSRLQDISYQYIKWLAKLFWTYQNNYEYAKSYLPYLDLPKEQKNWADLWDSDRSSLKNNILKWWNKSETKYQIKNSSKT